MTDPAAMAPDVLHRTHSACWRRVWELDPALAEEWERLDEEIKRLREMRHAAEVLRLKRRLGKRWQQVEDEPPPAGGGAAGAGEGRNDTMKWPDKKTIRG